MEVTTTYTVKSKNYPTIWEFKYDLNGVLTSFKIDGSLNQTQIDWLFSSKFPYKEEVIKKWKSIKNFEIIIGAPDLSFQTFWNVYGYKIKKVVSERAWKKLSKADRLNALKGVKKYNNFLYRKPGREKANAATYLNQKYWEDEYSSN
ncbi:hypothetical protein HN014_08030 [Aquimarina sp. TRL1]|uniref:hypothetical protein n=1 Tax=Aquimarina sp. (strain TRL1) TaxID=2736252 RepID=UPI00158D025E|nr:hypothetical protein [Aquimarina sp. TRL1]QKX04866.1 hypothetical protein HN014_08030 [Aquimarina sp. TRL1]